MNELKKNDDSQTEICIKISTDSKLCDQLKS